MRIVGFIFVALLVSTGLVVGDYFSPGTYLGQFLDGHFIETFAALVGFNIAAVIFLVGQLMVLEEKYGKKLDGTRKEIKHNAYFLLVSFISSLVLLFFRPDYIETTDLVTNFGFHFVNIVVLAVFGLAIFAIYEILHAVFRLSNGK